MQVQNVEKNEETKRIEEVLREQFRDIEAYRYNMASIRVRVIDERFRRKSKTEPENMVQPLIDRLPDGTQSDITVLLLLTEDERADSIMNLEFERPSRTSL